MFNNIWIKVQFQSATKKKFIIRGILGVVKDFNGLDITKSSNNIELSCNNHNNWLLKYHYQDTPSPKFLPSENITLSQEAIPSDHVSTTSTAASLNKLQVNCYDKISVQPNVD